MFALKENQRKKYELPGCTQALLLQEGLSPAPAPGTPCLFLSPSALLKDASWGCGPYSVCYTDGGSLLGGQGLGHHTAPSRGGGPLPLPAGEGGVCQGGGRVSPGKTSLG